MNRRVVTWLAAFLFAATVRAQPSEGPPPANVMVDEVRLEWIEPRREVTGQLRAVRQSTIAAEQPGRVAAVVVEEGDSVPAGTVLVRLDEALPRLESNRTQALLESAQANVAAREAGLKRARRDQESILRLGDSASEKEVLDARSDIVVAEAELAGAQSDALAAEAEHQLAQQRLDDMTIRAPFAGSVTRKHTEVGQWIGVGESVVELIDISVVDAWLDVPEALLDRLQFGGAEAQIRLRASGEVFAAPVSAVVPQADSLSRLFPVRVRLDNCEGHLRPGMSIVGLAPTGAREQMLTMHKDALLRDDGGAYVYIDSGGTAAPIRVRVLFAEGRRLVVESAGLQPGVRVVIEGNERLIPGQALNITSAPAPLRTTRGG